MKVVNAGDSLIGLMNQNGGNWTITTTDSNTGNSTTLSVEVPDTEMYAFVTLEVYGVNSCNDFPTGASKFTNLVIKTGDTSATPDWSPLTQDGIIIIIIINS